MAAEMRLFPSSDGNTIDIEVTGQGRISIVMECNESIDQVIVSRIDNNAITHARLQGYLNVGDILISVNGRVILDEDFEDTVAFIEMLKISNQQRRLKFLNGSKMSIEKYCDLSLRSAQDGKDKFGFLFKSEYFSDLDIEKFQKQNAQILAERDIQFVAYLKSIGGLENLKPVGVFKPSPVLKDLVRKGVPMAFRPSVWLHCSLASNHRKVFSADYYQSCLSKCNDANFLSEKVKEDIEKDLGRTFPQHQFFTANDDGINSLRRVLQAYAVHNPEVGYCQALNFLAGTMLLYMAEEDSFWLFVTALDTLLPRDYFTKSMVGVYCDQVVLSHMISLHLPEVYEVLEREHLQLPLITVSWFMCCYVNTIRHDVALRIWDMFFNEGVKVIFRIAMALFKLNEEKIISAKDGGELFMIMRDLGQTVIDADLLISTAYKDFPYQLSSNFLQSSKRSTSPRLKIQSPYGVVPNVLNGFGLAHVGPIISNSEKSEKVRVGPKKSYSTDDISYEDTEETGLSGSVRKSRTFSTDMIFGYGRSSSLSSSSSKSPTATTFSFTNLFTSLHSPSTSTLPSSGSSQSNHSNNDSPVESESVETKIAEIPISTHTDGASPKTPANNAFSFNQNQPLDHIPDVKLTLHSKESPALLLRRRVSVSIARDVNANTNVNAINGDDSVESEIEESRGERDSGHSVEILLSDVGSKKSDVEKSNSLTSFGVTSPKKSGYNKFKRGDIEELRNRFRPDLEEKFRNMEKMRQEWRDEEKKESSRNSTPQKQKNIEEGEGDKVEIENAQLKLDLNDEVDSDSDDSVENENSKKEREPHLESSASNIAKEQESDPKEKYQIEMEEIKDNASDASSYDDDDDEDDDSTCELDIIDDAFIDSNGSKENKNNPKAEAEVEVENDDINEEKSSMWSLQWLLNRTRGNEIVV